MWGCPCKTVDLYLGQNSALVCSEGQLSRLSTKYLTTASRLRGDPQSWLIFVILFCFFFKNAQWRYCWGPTRTEGQLMRRQQQHLTVCLHRSLPAACWPRERASGESAAGPEPPSLDRCCKLDELVPNWSEEENKRFARYFVCRSMYFFSYYIPLVGGTAVSLLWCSFNIFITGSCHHPPRLFYWFIWELHTTKKPTTLWAENTIAQAL